MTELENTIPSLVDTYATNIQSCLLNAKQSISNLEDDVLGMSGSSGVQTRHFFNNLLGMTDARYLEVDMGDVSTLCAAMIGNNAKIVSIGNFDLQDSSGMMMINPYKGANNLSVSSKQITQINVSQLPKINLYCEGAMTSELGTVDECLDDIFVYVTGDWNDSEKQANFRSAISQLGWTLLYEKEIFTPGDGFPTWWNGIFIGIVSKCKGV